MDQGPKVPHGTSAWFEMVGEVMRETAARAALPPGLNICLVERYTDGAGMGDGLVQGLRFELVGGKPVFRTGVHPGERGDITVDVTAAASRTLNTLYGADPAFHAALAALQASGEFKVEGDLSWLGGWFDGVHDSIVDRTR